MSNVVNNRAELDGSSGLDHSQRDAGSHTGGVVPDAQDAAGLSEASDSGNNGLRDESPAAFCQRMLVGTSRTFALSIPELPTPVDAHVQCAYLVCRMIDTLEDRPGVSEEIRQRLFTEFADRLGPPVRVGDLSTVFSMYNEQANLAAGRPFEDPCAELMARGDLVIQELTSFPEPAIAAIRDCAVEMTAGLRLTPLTPPNSPQFLFTRWRELERYCHYAAGVVGVMLARLFVACEGRDPRTLNRHEIHRAKRYGRGLQLTNIIKDHPSDLTDGRCFMPRELAAQFDLKEKDLLSPGLDIRVRTWVVRRAMGHLDAGLNFCLGMPTNPVGMRVFCVQPMMMAVLTLERVLLHHDPTPHDRPKITREQVRYVMETSREVSTDDKKLVDWYWEVRASLDRALETVEGS